MHEAEEADKDVSEAVDEEAGALGASLAEDLHEVLGDPMDAAEVIYHCTLTLLS